MKRKTASFTGTRPIFTGSPSIVMGGFNLDVANQRFETGTYIPAGTLAIMDEEKRTVSVIKSAKVIEVDSDDKKIVHLYVDEFYDPTFAVGDLVLKDGTAATAIASVPSVQRVERTDTTCIITLSAAISGLAEGDVLVEVVSDGASDAPKSKMIGDANCALISDVEVKPFETSVDVTADTMQYAIYERRVPPVPTGQKDQTGRFLKANPHVKFTKSY